MYLSLYTNICNSRKTKVTEYKPFSGLHEHHIIPKHSGGSDSKENLTYLTVREHIIAHFLLWKIYRNPNDLRSMKMLGAKLTPTYRREIGLFCKENGIGFHGATIEDKTRWRNKGLEKIKEKGYTISNMTPEERKKFAALGGSVGGKKQHELKIGIFDPDIQRRAAKMGGESHRGKKAMYRPNIDTTFIRVPPELWEQKLTEGYIFGSPYSPNRRSSSES